MKSVFNSSNCQMWGTRKASSLKKVRYISIKRIVKVDLSKRIRRSKVTELGPPPLPENTNGVRVARKYHVQRNHYHS